MAIEVRTSIGKECDLVLRWACVWEDPTEPDSFEMPDVSWPSVEGVLRLREIAMLEGMLCKTLSSTMGGSRKQAFTYPNGEGTSTLEELLSPVSVRQTRGLKMLLGWMN